MAPSQWLPRRLCLAALVAVPAAGSTDGASLVQSAVQVHVDEFDPAGPKKPDIVIASRSMKVKSEGGAAIDVVFKRANCVDCPIHWGDKTSAAVKMHVPGGLQKDDKLAMQFDANVHVANDTHPWNVLLPYEGTKINRICEFCSGSCILEAKTVSNISMDAKFPSPYNMESICDGKENALTLKQDVTDVSVDQFEIDLPSQKNLLTHIEGRVDATVSLLRRNGRTKASVSTALKFSPTGDEEDFNMAREEGREGWANVEVEEVEASVVEQQTGSFAQDIMEMGSKFAQGLVSLAGANKLAVMLNRDAKTDTEHVSGIDWKYTNVEGELGAGQFNLTMDPSCKALDGNGSWFCQLDFDQMQSGSINMNLNAFFDMGSTLKLQVRPRSLDEDAARILQLTGAGLHMDYEWPTCGRHTQVKNGNKYVKSIMPACGSTMFSVDVPWRHFSQLEHPINTMDMLKQLPKVSLLADVKLVHADGSIIWHVTLEGSPIV